jgi:hypothetical protein
MEENNIPFQSHSKEEMKSHVEIIYNDKNVVAMIPKTQVGSMIYGRKTKWCQLYSAGFRMWSEKAGHSSTSNHPSGRAVDISLTPNLVSFFSNPANGVVNVGDNSKCNTKYSFSGLIFWDEAQGCDSVGGARHYHASVSGK